MKYRSRTDIIAGILGAASHGSVTRTRIMYESYLSFAQLTEYLAFLLEKDLLSFDPESKKYTLTERGIRLVGILKEISEMISFDVEEKGMHHQLPEHTKPTIAEYQW